jgi:glycosyltransferase involved in cell wall biosynthesis
MLGAHRLLGSWERNVDAYLAPSRFCRSRFVDAGVSPRRIHYKPNFLARDPGLRTAKGSYALFVGRLSPEKGVFPMLQAWRQLRDVPLLATGDGPCFAAAEQMIARNKLPVNLLGQMSADQTLECIKGARFLVFPSLWDEPFGMGLLEAAACGVPSLASRRGAIPELVKDQKTGLLFDPRSVDELVMGVRWAWAHPQEMKLMGTQAREMYLQGFTAEKNYSDLMAVYSNVLNN